ncbi:MAG: hypothetical protein GX882_03850 [Methanomicrobiales archaeon]|nr:hypothetical protein [Methanomicrobiales archaeon]
MTPKPPEQNQSGIGTDPDEPDGALPSMNGMATDLLVVAGQIFILVLLIGGVGLPLYQSSNRPT